MDDALDIFREFLVLSQNSKFIDIGTITGFIFMIAGALATKRLLDRKERAFSEFLTIGISALCALICGAFVQYIIPYVTQFVETSFYKQIAIYPSFSVVLCASVFTLYSIHKVKAEPLSPLYSLAKNTMLTLAAVHVMYWLSLLFMELKQELTVIDLIYWLTVNYLSLSLAVACFFPKISLGKKGRFFVNPIVFKVI